MSKRKQPTVLGAVRERVAHRAWLDGTHWRWYGFVIGRTPKRWRVLWTASWNEDMGEWGEGTEPIETLTTERTFKWLFGPVWRG